MRGQLSRGGECDSAESSGALCRISVIECPRLKVKFQPRRDLDGRTRLYLLDQAGWFVSDLVTRLESSSHAAEETPEESEQSSQPADPVSRNRRELLLRLLEGLPHALLLENAQGDLQVMVPNQDVFRPPLRSRPFTTALIFDRASLGWQEVMETRYYLYPVHTSLSLLMPGTLASTLYLILLLLLGRQYSRVFRLLDSCTVDVPFTTEERWVFGQLDRSKDDRHPDSLACRIKLSLAVRHSENKFGWELHQELDEYLHKLPHVSAACRLSLEEELDALRQCRRATPRIRTQLATFKAVDSALIHHNADPAAVQAAIQKLQSVELEQQEPRWGGAPWNRMLQTPLPYLESQGKELRRIHYVPPLDQPRSLDEVGCATLVWEDLLVSDEESGANAQLGFFWLYQVMNEEYPLTMFGEKVNRGLGELLLRYWHLKMVRWGREESGEGEVDQAVSIPMSQLACLLNFPEFRLGWPQTPRDNNIAWFIRQGFDLHSKQARHSPLKDWKEQLDTQWRSVMM